MKYNQLGRTGLFVSELCLGTMTFGGNPDAGYWAAMGTLRQDAVDPLVERALAAGVNFIDTANVYSNGESERLVGQSLRNLGVNRSDVVIATKCTLQMGSGPNAQGASRGHIMDSVKQSLDRLQLDYIDLYQIHANDCVTPVEETLRALDDLVSQGLVRYVGVSNWRAAKIAKALGVSAAARYARFETLQAFYSIAGRDIEREHVHLLKDEQMGLMVWSPLAGGLLSGKFGPGSSSPEDARRSNFDYPIVDMDRAWACITEMRRIGDAQGVSVARIALAWLLAKSHVTSVIIGAKRLDQLEDNLGAVDVQLSAEDLASLDAVSQLPPEYGDWVTGVDFTRRPAPFVPAGN
ncbi:aldo/keto reductase (plasmid) [Rhizorhabdus wittichii]|uniref:Aldo/keto reductase n=1 Tax=Rhizorhabdus wittichii TaxID=160791 RepID=A0A975D8K2_9SPHN|nr:aldo/keto reductase [Rhizorhabdus wittichii]QTH24995.1 aldo/keto reductase [Rhizorhabdus wittichii]